MTNVKFTCFKECIVFACILCGTASAGEPRIDRTNNRSPEYFVSEEDVGFYMDYTGYRYSDPSRTNGERFFMSGLGPKVLQMIESAEDYIIFSVFLFDSFYAEAESPRDVVGTLTDRFLRKKAQHPDITIAVLLDPSHKAYGRRVSKAERLFRENGIDIFYSDLVSGLKKGGLFGVRESMAHVGRVLDAATFRLWGRTRDALLSHAPLPAGEFDGEQVTMETAYNALLLKANHRKLLVTDVAGEDMEAMVASANPHNASAYHVNTAITVKGDPARYVFNMLREDAAKSIRLGTDYAHWHFDADRSYRKHYLEETWPVVSIGSDQRTRYYGDRQVGVKLVTEAEIPREIIRMLEGVQTGDEVKIQMFYLSYKPVIEAILDASERVEHPIRLLLDANKDSFNRVKDGTPNRQVARFLLEKAKKRGGRIEVRWYATHGEQNHAKIMSITNPHTGKRLITTGSCNWTGRNMAGVNMEANVVVSGSRKLNNEFDRLFDLFWTNGDGNEYSLDYEAFSEAAPDWKWIKGEKPFYWSTF